MHYLSIVKTITTVLIAFFIWSCTGSNTTLNSLDYDDPIERIEILKNEIVSSSDFADAEFRLFNVNGFSDGSRGVPGASSWNYEFGIKVDTSDLDKWTEGMTQVDSANYNLEWTIQITGERKAQWSTVGEPEIFRRGAEDVIVILYRDEGIVFKRIANP